jgi:hypothetical protein
MPTYADLSGWVISIIAGRFEVTADTQDEDQFLSGDVETSRGQP